MSLLPVKVHYNSCEGAFRTPQFKGQQQPHFPLQLHKVIDLNYKLRLMADCEEKMCDVSYKKHFTMNGKFLGKNTFLWTRKYRHSDTKFNVLRNTQTQTDSSCHIITFPPSPPLIAKPVSNRHGSQYHNCSTIRVASHTVQYSTVQCSTLQYSTIQCSTLQYSTVQCSTVQ